MPAKLLLFTEAPAALLLGSTAKALPHPVTILLVTIKFVGLPNNLIPPWPKVAEGKFALVMELLEMVILELVPTNCIPLSAIVVKLFPLIVAVCVCQISIPVKPILVSTLLVIEQLVPLVIFTPDP